MTKNTNMTTGCYKSRILMQAIRLLFLSVFISAIILIFIYNPSALCQEKPPDKHQDAREMTLHESILIALRNNTTIKSAYLDRIVQKFDLKVSEDKFTPKLTISSTAQRTSSTTGGVNTSADSLSASATVTETVPTGAEMSFTASSAIDKSLGDSSNTGSWSVTLTQPLLKGGGIDVTMASVKTAQLSEKINILSLKSTIMDTVTSVITAYRSFLQATKQLEISRTSLERARELVSVNKELIAAGRMAEVELVQTEADVASKEYDLLQTENSMDSARLSLIKLLDIDKSTRIVPVEKITAEPAALNYEQMKAKALDNRTDYLSALLSLEISKINLMLAKNNKLWDLSLFGEYGGSSASGSSTAGDSSSRNWNAGMKLSIPIGDLTPQYGYISAKISLEKNEMSLAKLRETVEIEVQDAVRDAEMKLRQVKLASQSRALSGKKLEIEAEKMKAGRSSNFQLVTYQNDLVNAQNNELNAVINYLNALTSLDMTLGTTLDKWGIAIDVNYGDEYIR